MNAALLRKELRDLLPWGVLGLALGLSNVVEFLLEQIDLAPLGHTFRLLNQYNIVVYWVMAFAIGTASRSASTTIARSAFSMVCPYRDHASSSSSVP